MYQLPSLLTTQGLGLTKKGSVIRQGQGGEKPHSWRKPQETDCPQHPHGILCSYRTGPQWFNLMHKDVAHTVLNIPATGTQMAPAFYFKIEIIDSKKVHTAHGSTQTYLLIPKKVRPSYFLKFPPVLCFWFYDSKWRQKNQGSNSCSALTRTFRCHRTARLEHGALPAVGPARAEQCGRQGLPGPGAEPALGSGSRPLRGRAASLHSDLRPGPPPAPTGLRTQARPVRISPALKGTLQTTCKYCFYKY